MKRFMKPTSLLLSTTALLGSVTTLAEMPQKDVEGAKGPGRLIAKGIASVSPIASNDSETGRAKNRRVELVKQ
jgi:flagellar motor protein MotB